MKPIYLAGNLIFIRVDFRNTFVNNASSKYMAGAVSGMVFPNGMYTHEEIMTAYPDAKGVDTFLELHTAYYGRQEKKVAGPSLV